MEEWVSEKYVKNRDRRKEVENDEKYDRMCEKCCDAGRGNFQICFDVLQGVAQGCTVSTNLFKVYVSDMAVAVEAAKQVVTVGADAMSGLMFEDDFVGMSEAPEGLKRQIAKAPDMHYEMEVGSERN